MHSGEDDKMETRRIILFNGSHFLRGMLKRVINRTPGLQVAAELDNWDKLPGSVERTNADWVIVTLPSTTNLGKTIETSLSSHPQVRVLTVTADGRQVRLKGKEKEDQILSDLSLDELIAILRSKAEPSHSL